MIKAVILDWFITLAHFDPPREEIFCRAFAELGIDILPEQAIRGILLADEYLYTESIRSPIAGRSPEERQRLYMQFPLKVMCEANLPAGLIHDRVAEVVDELLIFARGCDGVPPFGLGVPVVYADGLSFPVDPDR